MVFGDKEEVGIGEVGIGWRWKLAGDSKVGNSKIEPTARIDSLNQQLESTARTASRIVTRNGPRIEPRLEPRANIESFRK